jgi:hypothetical protein
MKKLAYLLFILLIPALCLGDGITIQSRGAKKGVNDDIIEIIGLTNPLTVGQGGTGVSTSGTTGEIPVGGGTGSAIVWTAATGTGAPVRAISPILVTPALGTPASGVLTNATGLPTAGLASQVFAAGIGIGGKAAEAGGVSFPVTAVASADVNNLDDYQEGSFTATIVCSTSGTVTLNGSFDTLQYTKIGRVVTVTGILIVGSVSSPVGIANIGTLPFTSGGTTGYRTAVSLWVDNLETTGTTAMQARIGGASTVISLYHFTAGVAGGAAADLKAGSEIYINATYFTG